MSPETTASTPETVGDDGFVPLTVEEARVLVTEAPSGIDRDALLAERAEAEAQLRAAEATLGITPAAVANAGGDSEQEPDEPAQNHRDVEVDEQQDEALDVEALRRAATVARAADDALARAASEASDRPVPGETRLGAAETAFSRALQLQEEVPAAWRRLVGALISATGMGIVIGALGWNVYWLLVPIALIAIMTVDLRVAGKAARDASAEAAGELAEVGVAGTDGLDLVRRQRAKIEEAESRLAAARAERDAAYARFEELAPGRLPSEIEEIIAEHEADVAARREARAARAEVQAAAPVETESEPQEAAPVEIEAESQPEAEAPEPAEAEAPTAEPAEEPGEPAAPPPDQAPAETAAAAEPVTAPVAVPERAVAAEWWFGSKEPPPVPAAASGSVRALAERLSAEGREALARVEAQLAALDRVELAKRSLEWHEANGSVEGSQPAEESPPEKP